MLVNASALTRTLDRLRLPAYTGENRCVPCTLVNAVIAVLLAAALAAAGAAWFSPTAGAALAGVALAVSAASIYLRGYLVPGTPRLTKTYLPDRVLRWFDKAPAPAVDREGEVDVEAYLVEVGAVAECEHEDDLCLTDGFRAEWRERIEVRRGDDTAREDLGAILDVDPADIDFEEYGEAFVATHDGARIGQWESRAAFVADVAGSAVLGDRDPGWPALDIAERSGILAGLRLFLEDCPACGGPIEFGQEVVESCCRSIDVVAATCGACGARLMEAEYPS